MISVTGSLDAIRAYDWLVTSGAPYVTGGADTQFDMAPCLPDGTLLTSDRNLVVRGTGGSDALDGASGARLADTLDGASGARLADTLIGVGGTTPIAWTAPETS